jgi:hypothetical protein
MNPRRKRIIQCRPALGATLVVAAGLLAPGCGRPAAAATSSGTLFFIRSSDTSRPSLWASAPDGSGARLVVNGSDAFRVGRPNATLDGSKVVFEGITGSGDTYRSRVFTVNSDGTERTAWTDAAAPFYDYEPVWAPDASVYFYRYDDSRDSSQILHVTAPGALATPVPNTSGARSLTVSPDGRYLAFERDGSIVITRSDGTDGTYLYRRPRYGGAHAFQPAWSPDGREIAFGYDDPPYSTSIAVLPANTTEMVSVRIVATYRYSHTVYGPSWAEDSWRLFYAVSVPSTYGPATNLYRATADDALPPARITDNTFHGPEESSPSHGGGPVQLVDDASPPAPDWVQVRPDSFKAEVYWSYPAASGVSRSIVRWQIGTTPPASPSDGVDLYSGRRHRIIRATVADTTYTVRVWLVDWAGNLSEPATATFTTAHATSMTIAASTTTPVYGQRVLVTGTLLDSTTGMPAAQALVTLQANWGRSWSAVRDAVSDAQGRVTVTVSTYRKASYRWVFRGDEGRGSSVSPALLAATRWRLTANLSSTTVTRNGAVKVTARVVGTPDDATMRLQRYVSGAWRTLQSRRVSWSTTERFWYRPATRGTHKLRVHVSASRWLYPAATPTMSLTVT